jgi:hypothetical protein
MGDIVTPASLAPNSSAAAFRNRWTIATAVAAIIRKPSTGRGGPLGQRWWKTAAVSPAIKRQTGKSKPKTFKRAPDVADHSKPAVTQ